MTDAGSRRSIENARRHYTAVLGRCVIRHYLPPRGSLSRFPAARKDRRWRSEYFFETKRRERLGNQLAEIRRDLAQHPIVIPAAPYAAHANSPACFHIPHWPGKLETTCIDAQDLLRQLMELAQASGGKLV